MNVLVLANQKGGTGKTTSAAAVILSLRARGYKVQGLDLDPQGALSLLVSDTKPVTARALARTLRRYRSSDFVVVDTPPSMGAHITTAVNLSDAVIIPVVPEMIGMRGLRNLLDTIDESKVLGLLVVGMRRTVHHRTVLQKLKELQELYPILAIIPHSITCADAWALGDGILSYGPAQKMGLSKAYENLTGEIIKWADKKQ